MHSKNVDDVIKNYGTNISHGLSSDEAKAKLIKYGENKLTENEKISFFGLFINQFKSLLIIILIIASIISVIVGETTEGIVIIVIVLLNSFVGAKQEKSAGDAMKALRDMTNPSARVIRDGDLQVIESTLLVPGDILTIEVGNFVPADIRIIESTNLRIEESSLTGESIAVEKDSTIILPEDTSISDMTNCAFMGTIVTYGHAKGIVISTGMNTEIGKIAGMLEGKDEETPLQKKLNVLGRNLGLICIAVCVIIFALGLIRQIPLLEIFMISVSLAVAAVPEGLPAIVTVILALGMKKMVKKNVLIKNLGSVETLGSTTVICSDKTGTLTQNRMTVTKIFNGKEELEVLGSGYSMNGAISDGYNSDNFKHFMYTAILCNDSDIKKDEEDIIGDPTEGALLILASKGGFDYEEIRKKYPRIKEYPFDSERKMMSTTHEIDNITLMLTKGSPDSILSLCTKIEIDGEVCDINDYKDLFNKIYKKWATQALRVLCYAYKEVSNDSKLSDEENNLILCGMSGMIDPPREEAEKAILKCKEAGIRVIMITGDYSITASAIGENIGLLSDDEEVVTGKDIDLLSDDEFINKVKYINVFSRVSPKHKVKIVDSLRLLGQITAMTGDGVNDAPSLKKADIGIAMGISGTDVSKEAADMVLLDDNFVSIVGAVEEGRVLYSNIRKFVSFLISCNIGELLLILISMILGWGSPLRPIQLLWVNLITDSFPAFALGLEPKENDVMKMNPRNPETPIIDKKMRVSIFFQAIALACATLLSFRIGYNISPTYANTFAFITLISGELLRSFSCRSENKSVLKTGLFSNKFLNYAVIGSYMLTSLIVYVPYLRNIFNIHVLSISQLLIALSLSLIPFAAGELSKKIKI